MKSGGREAPLTTGPETPPSTAGEAEPLSTTRRETVMEKALLTVGETAEILSLSRSRVYELMNKNVLASVRIGRSRRVSVASVNRLLHSESLV